eukprot:CAMPEP_0194207316 /NCGR_PEP_ID=MMETSP0156-20130528/6086_1 /TAXON_ID=33649 /ORGANISM="Thalassionema nitzschioides, Strain L26-B" /LENGTH=391 /DNA_ID=CAMNT_0038934041 /DNA_START=131 /DNA_END=1309 /DNA_ORIENTATION=+
MTGEDPPVLRSSSRKILNPDSSTAAATDDDSDDKQGKALLASDADEIATSRLDIACNSHRPPEYHTFVLWDPALWESQEELLDKTSVVEVVDKFEATANHLEWCLTIYGSQRDAKVHGNCKPNGNPKVVVVRDPKPDYGEWKTLGALQVLNKNMYSLKTKMRGLNKLGWKSVHSSNNVEETKLVLEPLNRKQYGPPLPEFNAINDIFDLLDEHNCFRYVVLRSHEEIKQDFISKDVDILVNDYFMFKSITGAANINRKKMRDFDNGPNTQVIIGGKWTFDVRYVGDGYYSTDWELQMLRDRVKIDGVWVQESMSYAMSLIYHYLVHKPPNTKATSSRWVLISQEMPQLDHENSCRARTELKKYLTAHNYTVTKPHDTDTGYYPLKPCNTPQ